MPTRAIASAEVCELVPRGDWDFALENFHRHPFFKNQTKETLEADISYSVRRFIVLKGVRVKVSPELISDLVDVAFREQPLLRPNKWLFLKTLDNKLVIRLQSTYIYCLCLALYDKHSDFFRNFEYGGIDLVENNSDPDFYEINLSFTYINFNNGFISDGMVSDEDSLEFRSIAEDVLLKSGIAGSQAIVLAETLFQRTSHLLANQDRSASSEIVAGHGKRVLGEKTARMLAGRDEPPSLPTHEELEQAGKLYSQRTGRGSTEGARVPIEPITGKRDDRIIQHLKDVWMPWIQSGTLTLPDLQRDPSAYVALSKWRSKPGNDLKKSLGYDIPSKSDLIDRLAADALRPGDRPAHVVWAIRQREAKNRQSR